jgi:hypothetical protein
LRPKSASVDSIDGPEIRRRENTVDKKYMPAATWITLVVAIVLLVSPWIFAFPAGAVTLNAVIAGLLVGGAAGLALLMQRRGSASWLSFALLNLVLGGWVFISPLMLHFNGANAATWIHMLGGIAVTLLAMLEVWRAVGKPAVPTLTR